MKEKKAKREGLFARLKKTFSKENFAYSYQKYAAFTALQAREVFAKEKQATKTSDKIINIVTPIIKFVVVTAISFLVCFLMSLFGVVMATSMFHLLVLFTTIMIVLQLLSTISSSTRNYYISEDNKILITFPSRGGSLFLSKLTIEFLKQLKSIFEFYYPAVCGLIIYCSALNVVAPFQLLMILWAIIPTILMVAIIVLIGSLISVVYLQYLRLVKVVPAIRVVVLLSLFGVAITLAVLLINKIPADLDLIRTWGQIKANIDQFLIKFSKADVPINWFCSTLVGVTGSSYRGYHFKFVCVGRAFALLGIVLVLFAVVFLLIKMMFIYMMSKSVDYEKVSEKEGKLNKVHHKHTTFAFKEFKISFRTFDISGTYIVTYVLIPVLILLLCKIFDAINTSMKGNMLSIMFNVLLIVLPLLASNTPIASAYSREGHAGYMKKTKPIAPLTPMFSKLIFNLILSIPSIFASMFIVGSFGKIDVPSVVLIGISVLLLQYAHIFYTSTLDFVNPKNESYQTEGQNAKNSNENVATAIAFVMSFIFAFLVYLFFQEEVRFEADNFIKAARKLLYVGIITFASCITLYLLKLKAYFMEK
mgnify:CR=1 FL=1